MSYTLVLEWMPGDLYMSAVTARCTAPTSSYSVVWLPPNKVYQITLYCGSTSLVSFLVGAFRGKAWSYMISFEHVIRNPVGLHARPAGLLTKLVKEHNYTINISYNGRTVRADRMLQMVSLGAVTGATILVEIFGETSGEDIRLIRTFFEEQL